MDFALSEEQEMIKTSARRFLDGLCTEEFIRNMEKAEKGHSPDIWKRMAEFGWLGMVFPEENGGGGSNIVDLAVLYGEFGRAMLPSPHLSTVVLCGLALLEAGNASQKAEFLHRIANGETIMAFALTEPSARWDAEGVQVSAVCDGESYLINGTKLFVHDAHVADYILCVTRTKRTRDPESGITLFLVDSRTPGVHCSLLRTTAGDNKQCEVVFNNVRVPRSQIVGKLNGGWSTVLRVLQVGSVMLCAQMAGASQRILEMTVDYAKTRIQFDEPIGVNQYVQEHCVNLLACTDSSWWVTFQAAWNLSTKLPCEMQVATAKAWTSDAHEQACWYAHQVFAGVGYTTEVGMLPLFSRRGKIAQLYLGDASFHREVMAKQMERWTLEMPRGKPLGIFEEDQIPAWDRTM